MSLTDDARAEAEKRYRGPRMNVGTVVDREVSAYTSGYLAGHEAASRQRDTPTVEQVVAVLDEVIVLPGDRRDWSDGMREAYERRTAHDYTSAWAAARRVYVRETAERVVALFDNTEEGT